MSDDTPPAAPDPARGRFLGDLAHDLSTPLTAIHGALELILAGAYGPVEGEQRALVLEVIASAREMRALVQDVADLGALDTGRFTFNPARVNVAVVLDELRSAATDAAAKRGVTFALEGPDERSPIEIDERRLRQIVDGLFGYAVKATRRGSQVNARVSLPEGSVHVEVRATGIPHGSDPEALFADQRGPAPGVPKPYRGPGLGLPLVGRIVRAWGGQAHAEMNDGTLALVVDIPTR